MDEGCLIQIAIYVAIAMAIVFAIAAAVVATIACGSVYGTYKAMVCYATALKRTYGSDEDYEAGNGMKTIVSLILVVLVLAIFVGFSALVASGTGGYRYY
jgi:hypothetical protein